MKSFKIKDFVTIIIGIAIIVAIIAVISFVSGKIHDTKQAFYVTMLGGSNLKDNGDTQSMGYIIKTKDNHIIVVDGGRENDKDYLVERIKQYGNNVNYWFITHPHGDHVGALYQILVDDNCDIKIDNLYYHFNDLPWYQQVEEERFPDTEKYINAINSSSKISNKVDCKKGDVFSMDNLECKILRVGNMDANDENFTVNDSSMVFKFTEIVIGESIIFLGDANSEASKELLETCPDDLSSYAVQMAHHGQNGVTEDVYKKIDPKVCFFNSPEWLYNNDSGSGYNSGNFKTLEVRDWVSSMEAESYVAYKGDLTIKFSSAGHEIFESLREKYNLK